MIFISGPYSKGDVLQNVHNAIYIADQLLRAGFVPYCPHLSHYWHQLYPHTWEEWLSLDRQILFECEAVLLLPGDSEGSEIEVQFAKEYGIPVFNSIDDLIQWRDGI